MGERHKAGGIGGDITSPRVVFKTEGCEGVWPEWRAASET